jgi:hypothetical protein
MASDKFKDIQLNGPTDDPVTHQIKRGVKGVGMVMDSLADKYREYFPSRPVPTRAAPTRAATTRSAPQATSTADNYPPIPDNIGTAEVDSGILNSGTGKKRGGKVKKMASGGTASKRADGCCVRGKTKGRMV